MEEGIIDPLAIKRHHRISDGPRPSTHQHFLTAVRMKQHEVGAGIHEHRVGDFRPVGADGVSPPWRTDVDDVVIELHIRVAGDWLWVAVGWRTRSGLSCERDRDEENRKRSE